MAAATKYEFAVFVNGIEQPGTRFVTSILDPLDQVVDQKQLSGECHIQCSAADIITVRNVSDGDITLNAVSSTSGSVNAASITVTKVGD